MAADAPKSTHLSLARLSRTDQTFADSGEVFGVVVTRDGHGVVHSGIVFRRHFGRFPVGYVHVKWDRLLGGAWEFPGVWASPTDGSADMQERLEIAAELADQILQQYRQPQIGLPYGIGWRGSTFVQVPGAVVLRCAPGTFGLTCATLVLAVCKHAGIDLIEEVTWQRRPDRDQELVRLAERHRYAALADQFRAEIEAGALRIRPEEVTAACCCDVLPATFGEVEPLAAAVLEMVSAEPRTHAAETRIRQRAETSS